MWWNGRLFKWGVSYLHSRIIVIFIERAGRVQEFHFEDAKTRAGPPQRRGVTASGTETRRRRPILAAS